VVGEHNLSFGIIDGYIAPENEVVLVEASQAIYITGAYLSQDTFEITKVNIKAGQNRAVPGDSIKVFGESFSGTGFDMAKSNSIYIGVYNEDGEEPVFHNIIPFNITEFKNGKYLYKNRESERITTLKIDLNRNTFFFEAKKITLNNLSCPIVVKIEIGNYHGMGIAYDNNTNQLTSGDEEPQDVINGNAFIPLKLLSGCANSLRIDKCDFRLGTNKPNTDSLKIQGAMAVKDTWINILNEDIVVCWGDHKIILPANDLYQISSKIAFKYKKPEGSDSSIDAAVFDMEKCYFKIIVKNADIGVQSNPIDFGIKFTNFNETVPLQLIEKKSNLFVYP